MFPQEFEPRLNSDGMMNKHIWYSDNPFYQAGYGLPNCTCYSWGRFWEVTSFTGLPITTRPQLPLSDAGTWYARVDTDIYQKVLSIAIKSSMCYICHCPELACTLHWY